MNILFIATVYNHLAAFHKPFIQYFQNQGYVVHVAGSNSMGRREELEELGVICHDISFDRSIFTKNNKKALKELRRLFSSFQFNLIHVHTPIAAFLARFILRKYKNQGSVIYTAHGFHFFEGAPKKNWIIYYTAEKLAVKWTDYLITLNKEDFDNAFKLGFPLSKVSMVHGVGVTTVTEYITENSLKEYEKSLDLPRNSVVIGYVAELNYNKNHQFLLNNWKWIKENNPNAVLLIIGAGEYKEKLQNFIQKEQLKDIKFLGFRQDVHQLLKIIDIVTLLSYREGLPKSIMEAMAEGLPCIVTNTRGLRDLIKDGENGFVVNHGDTKQLIKAFTSLISSSNLREQMGQASVKKVQPYLLDNVMNEYIDIYKKLL